MDANVTGDGPTADAKPDELHLAELSNAMVRLYKDLRGMIPRSLRPCPVAADAQRDRRRARAYG